MSISQDFTFTAHDLFSVAGANHSGRSYSRLADALERLQGKQIRTNIEAGGEGEEGFFFWLLEARMQYARTSSGEKRLKAVKVRLCDWLFRTILSDRQVLAYGSTYFQLGPIELRIFEVARSSSADGEPVDIDLPLLKLQTGFQNPLSNFRIAMRQIAAANAIPDYDIQTIDDASATSLSETEDAPRKAGRRPTPARVIITRRAALRWKRRPSADLPPVPSPAPAYPPARPLIECRDHSVASSK